VVGRRGVLAGRGKRQTKKKGKKYSLEKKGGGRAVSWLSFHVGKRKGMDFTTEKRGEGGGSCVVKS